MATPPEGIFTLSHVTNPDGSLTVYYDSDRVDKALLADHGDSILVHDVTDFEEFRAMAEFQIAREENESRVQDAAAKFDEEDLEDNDDGSASDDRDYDERARAFQKRKTEGGLLSDSDEAQSDDSFISENDDIDAEVFDEDNEVLLQMRLFIQSQEKQLERYAKVNLGQPLKEAVDELRDARRRAKNLAVQTKLQKNIDKLAEKTSRYESSKRLYEKYTTTVASKDAVALDSIARAFVRTALNESDEDRVETYMKTRFAVAAQKKEAEIQAELADELRVVLNKCKSLYDEYARLLSANRMDENAMRDVRAKFVVNQQMLELKMEGNENDEERLEKLAETVTRLAKKRKDLSESGATAKGLRNVTERLLARKIEVGTIAKKQNFTEKETILIDKIKRTLDGALPRDDDN